MRNCLLFILVILSTFVFLQCNDRITESQEKPALQLTGTEKKLAFSSEELGIQLVKKLDTFEQQKNIFFSPLSISYALGMVLNGSRNETHSEIKNVMGLDNLTLEEINSSFHTLTTKLTGIDPKTTFQIANSIWYRKGFKAEPSFLSVNQQYFDAYMKELDFSDAGAAGAINSWVNDKTKGKIQEIVDNPIDPAVVMYLINALYFKGIWTYKFDAANTFDGLFEKYNHTTVPVKYMAQQAEFNIYHSTEFTTLEIPYGNNSYSMVVLLPNQNRDLPGIINSFTPESLNNIFNKAVKEKVTLILPRFTIRYEIELKDILEQLGMVAAFNPSGADFTGINKDGDIYISKVKHKTYVNVDEEGTEAAAVTSVEFERTSAGNEFRADHPFMFFIKENTTNTVLFTGVIYEPNTQVN